VKSKKYIIFLEVVFGITLAVITFSNAKSRLIDKPISTNKTDKIKKDGFVERCSSNAQCKRGSERSVCDQETKRCVQCLEKSHCPRDKYCDTSLKKCVSCVTNAHCTSPDKICGPEKTCVECTVNSHCDNPRYPKCVNNKCVE